MRRACVVAWTKAMIMSMRMRVMYLWVLAVWAVQTMGYLIRPYDMLADARRWWFQPAQRCGWR